MLQKMSIRCISIFYRGEKEEKEGAKKSEQARQTLTGTLRFGEITFPLKRDYAIEIAPSMRLLRRTYSKFHP